MNIRFSLCICAATTLAALVVNAEAARRTGASSFHDTYRRNTEPAPRALNLAAKIKAAENDALRLARKIAALNRPTITAYSNVKAPEPPSAARSAAAASSVININGSTVVINQNAAAPSNDERQAFSPVNF